MARTVNGDIGQAPVIDQVRISAGTHHDHTGIEFGSLFYDGVMALSGNPNLGEFWGNYFGSAPQYISYLTSLPSSPPALIGFFHDAFKPIFFIYLRSPK